MSAPARTHSPSALRAFISRAGFYAAVAAMGLAGVALMVMSASPVGAVLPVALLAALGLMLVVPLRWSASALIALMLVPDESQETGDRWSSGLAMIGDLTHYRLDSTLPVPGGALSGMELMIVILIAIAAYRKASRKPIDEIGRVESASVVRDLIIIYLAGVFLAEVIGLAQGWGAVPYKLRNLVHPMMLGALFIVAFRGPHDAVAVGRIIMIAACTKGVISHLAQEVARAQTGGMLRAAISHGESMTFSIAAVLLGVRMLESPQRRGPIPSVVIMGFILLGCLENNRRIVWVMMAMSVLVIYLIRPFAGWQRSVTKIIIVTVPLILIYTALGWESGSRFFSPVQVFRGVVDTSHDTSAYWREVEAWNIMVSMRGSAILGMGLGGEYTEYMQNDDISAIYKEYREWPHNTVLGLMMMMGLFGFTAHWIIFPAVLFLSIRSYWRARSLDERMLAVGCIAAVVACLVMAWGDTGAHYPQFKVYLGLATAFSAKLAVATGAWPKSQPIRRGTTEEHV